MHHLILPWEMYTQFGDPAYISHHTNLSATRVIFGFIQMCLETSIPRWLVELFDALIIPIAKLPGDSELSPWKCFRKACKVCRCVWAMNREGPSRPGSPRERGKVRAAPAACRGSSAIPGRRVEPACFISLCKVQIQ